MRAVAGVVVLAVALVAARVDAKPGVRLPRTAQQQQENARAEQLNQRARAAFDAGRYREALGLAEESRRAFERLFGPNDVGVASAWQVIGRVHLTRGDLPHAEHALTRELAILEGALGPEHEALIHPLNALSALYHAKGDYSRAIEHAERALVLLKRAVGPEHPNVATVLNNIAQARQRRGEREEAERLMRHALAIREKALGPDDPMVAVSLSNLAVVEYDHGRYATAIQMLERALAIEERAVGRQHPRLLAVLNNLALQVGQQGDHQRAEQLYRRALAICEAAAPEHPQLGGILENLAAAMWRANRLGEALRYQQQANEARERLIAKVLTAGSENQRRMFLRSVATRVDGSLSLHAQALPDDPAALRMALTQVLRSKGRLLDATAGTLRALRRRLGAEDQKLLGELSALRTQLAESSLAGRPRDQLAPKIARAERLEAELAARSAAFRSRGAKVALESVQAAIPADAALIEIARYRPFEPSARAQSAEPRYAGYVLRSQGGPSWADLGLARRIDDVVERLRAELGAPNGEPATAARELDQLVMVPLRKLTGDVRHLLIAPDGALHLVPFAALVDEQGRYLVQTLTLTYLTTGRDLLRMPSDLAASSPALIMVNPEFGARSRPVPDAATRAADWRKVVFAPLPATAEEGRAIADLIEGATLLTGAAASEGRLKAAHGPRLLHVATHGFFLDGPQTEPVGSGRGLELAQDAVVPTGRRGPLHPLMRSGLAFAGANERRGKEDGVLTAYEAASLDLWGTRLVVLSACETGVGAVQSGEGVYGLRRALTIAGAETLVMSLWKVDDTATRDLMHSYYEGLQRGGGRSSTLREAQLAMLADPRYAHPYFWASFIPIGDWRTLDGNAPTGPSDGAAAMKVAPARGCGCRTRRPATSGPFAWCALFLAATFCRWRRGQRRSRAAGRVGGAAAGPGRAARPTHAVTA